MTVDRWLIERVFEPATWRLQRWGISSWQAARVLLAVWLAGYAAQALGDGLWTALTALVALLFPFRLLAISELERSVGRGTANPEKHRAFDILVRAVLVAAIAIGAIATIALWRVMPVDIANAAYLMHLYLCACERPPPAEQEQADVHLVPEGAS
jgi:hypothetical protein